MTSLAEAYDRRGRDDRRPTLWAGRATFAAGVVLVLAAMGVVATEALGRFGGSVFGARELAGILGGLGVPVALLGIVVIIPAHRSERLMTLAGVAVAVVGVWRFTVVYPYRWVGATGPSRTVEVALLYAAGVTLILLFVLRAVADFKTRNSPQGTVTLEVTRHGVTKVVEVDASKVESRSELERAATRAHEQGGD